MVTHCALHAPSHNAVLLSLAEWPFLGSSGHASGYRFISCASMHCVMFFFLV